MKTVGELKRYIESLPDDMPLVKYHEDMEKHGYMNRMFCDVKNMTKETRKTYDRFDYTNYTYEVYEPDENGQPCLCIN